MSVYVCRLRAYDATRKGHQGGKLEPTISMSSATRAFFCLFCPTASGDVGAALAALEPASAPMEGGVNCGAGGRCSVAMAVAAADGRNCVPAGMVVL